MKVLRSIFPLYFWIILFLGIICLFTENSKVFAYILLNLAATLFFIKLGVVIHEIGHLLFGKLAGGNPKRIVLGKSHEVMRLEVFGVKIILNKDFNGGFAFVNFPKGKNTKFNQFLLSSGGFIINLIVAYLVYLIFGYNFSFLSGRKGLDFSSAFIFTNTLLAIVSLLPYYVDYMGIKVPTDGLTLLKLPFKKKNETNVDFNDFFEAQEKFEIKKYDEAIHLYKKYIDTEDAGLLARYNIGLMYSKKGNTQEAIKWMEACFESVTKEKNKKMFAHINNALAWLKLVKGDPKDIDILSKTAYSIKPDFSYFIGTRGSVLIELGKVEVGIKMLKPLVDFKYPNNQTVSAAVYIYYGFIILKELKKSQKYLNFVTDNIEVLDEEEKILWDRIKDKVKELESS